MSDITPEETSVGFAMCGSFCTFSKAIAQMEKLVSSGYRVTPILSENALNTNTRFGKAEDFRRRVEEICETKVIDSIVAAEPIGPKKMFDILIIAPCSGNTLAKLASGIVDSVVTLAAKSHLRNAKPLLIGVSTNDALAGAGKNIGTLLNYKNYYFVPMGQDSYTKKPRSVVLDFDMLIPAMEAALEQRQLQPILLSPKQ